MCVRGPEVPIARVHDIGLHSNQQDAIGEMQSHEKTQRSQGRSISDRAEVNTLSVER